MHITIVYFNDDNDNTMLENCINFLNSIEEIPKIFRDVNQICKLITNNNNNENRFAKENYHSNYSDSKMRPMDLLYEKCKFIHLRYK